MRRSTPPRTLVATTLAAGALALAACGAGGSTGAGGSAGAAGPAGAAAPAGTSSAALTTWTGPLGETVVTADGRAVYAFDKDTPGSATSACTGTCAHLWFAVTTTAPGTPQVSGVTGPVGTVPASGGGRQLTLDGHRLYTYAGDGGPRQVSGEGVMGLWWAVSPSGQEVHGTAAAPSSSDSGGYTY